MGHTGTFPALRRRMTYLARKMAESRDSGRKPLPYDIAEHRELQVILGKHRPRPQEEPPVIPLRETKYEETYEVPNEPRGNRYFPGGQL